MALKLFMNTALKLIKDTHRDSNHELRLKMYVLNNSIVSIIKDKYNTIDNRYIIYL